MLLNNKLIKGKHKPINKPVRKAIENNITLTYLVHETIEE